MYDAIVIGPHGVAPLTARLLIEKGYRVVFLEQSVLPIYIRATSLITATSNGQVRHWDLSEQNKEMIQPVVEQTLFDLGSFSLIGFPREMDDGFAGIYAPQRIVRCKSLIDEAVAAEGELTDDGILDTALIDVAVEESHDALNIWHVKPEHMVRLRTRSGGVELESMQMSEELQSLSASSLPATDSKSYYYTMEMESHDYHAYWSGIPGEELALCTRAQLYASLTGGFPEGATSFQQGNTKASQHLGKIFFAVMQCYYTALQESRFEGLLTQLKAIDMDVRGYAFEAVAQGLLQSDCLLPGKN